MLIDTHCHLDFPQFAPEIEAVVERARAAGVGRMVTICTRLDRLPATIGLIERFDALWGAIGIHPHEAKTAGDLSVETLLDLTRHPRMIGIGETGLDYHYDLSPRDEQAASFRIHIRAAFASGLPLIVHTRNAEADTIRILQEEAAGRPVRGIIHCFSGTAALAGEALALGMHISFSGIATFNRSEEIRGVARDMPADRILVETDAPYLAPVPKRGKTNEPAFVAHTAAAIAATRGEDPAAFAARTTANALGLFGKMPPLAA